MRRFAALFGLAAACAAAGCAGGGSSVQQRAQGVPAATPVPSGPVATASIAFQIAIPARAGSAKLRQPRYVSPATQVVQIAVNGGTPQTFTESSGQPCSSPSSPPASGTCTVYAVQAPVGTDTFVVTLRDGSNNVLSSGTVQATIVQDQTNTVSVVFDGVPASLRISLSNGAPPTGSASRFSILLQPLDADGFTIIGAPGNLPAITVSDGDSSGATGLYLAGSDGTCATQSAPPAHSVTTTVSVQSANSYYTNVCLAYNGQAIPAATLTASSAGVPNATATFAPAAPSGASGVWIAGLDSNGNPALERFDANLAPQAEVTGSNTQLPPQGMALDASNNVYTVVGGYGTARINMYPASANGNVAPSSSTTFSYPNFSPVDLALDDHGGAYIVQTVPGDTCAQILYVPLTGSASTATPAGPPNCNLGGSISGLATDGHGYLYAGSGPNTHNTPFQIERYTIGSGGSLTLDAVLTNVVPYFNVDRLGNVFATGGVQGPIVEYPAGTFVHGQRVAVSNQPSDAWPGGDPVGIDAAENVFAAKPVASGSPNAVLVFPAGSHTASATANFTPYFIQGLR
jgi:hypothetical protein